jgi:hypothetical protein
MRKQTSFFKFIWSGLFALAVFLAGCDMGAATQVADLPPTATLAPLVSLTPRLTATPIPTRTPLPSDTPTPSDTPETPTPSNTPPPTATPPITGIIASIQSVNIREGPGVAFGAFEALNPGTGVLVLGQNEDGSWINIRLDDGREGWISSTLLRLRETTTPVPTFTPSPNLTALALGTSLPTAVVGGGTVTPTPPRSLVTPTIITGTPPTETLVPTNISFLPIVTPDVINVTAINQTATALSRNIPTNAPILAPPGGSTATTRPTLVPGATTSGTPLSAVIAAGGSPSPTFTPAGPLGPVSVQDGTDVLAYCDDPAFGIPAPTNLAAGSRIDVFWQWFATTPEQVQEHITAANYEVRVDGVLLNYQGFVGNVRQEGPNYVVYWYVPFNQALEAGQHRITYRLTWNEGITDGYALYGPGSNTLEETGSCTFTVR